LAPKQIAFNLPDAPTGDVDHYFSAAFQQAAGFAFNVRLQKLQRAVRVFVN
jgi:hypothetical protein